MDISDISTIKITMQNGVTEEFPYGSPAYVDFILRNAQDIIGKQIKCQQKNDDDLRSDEVRAYRRILQRNRKSR